MWRTDLLDRSRTTSCLDSKLVLNIYEQILQFMIFTLANDLLLPDLQVWPWPSTYLNKCYKWITANIYTSIYKCRSYGPDKLTLDHFIIWPSSVTLTFNVHAQMFQTTLLLLKDNNYAKLFRNPCLTVQVMAQTISTYDHFIIWLSSVTLTNLIQQIIRILLLFLNDRLIVLFKDAQPYKST